MDGFEATAAIRTQEAERGGHLPIVAMTAHALAEDRERCLNAGMDGYISKPIARQQLFDAIEAVTAGARPADAAVESPPVRPVLAFDERKALDLVDGDRELLAETMHLFMLDWPTRWARVRRAAERQDGASLHAEAHALKGSSASFGGDAVAAASQV